MHACLTVTLLSMQSLFTSYRFLRDLPVYSEVIVKRESVQSMRAVLVYSEFTIELTSVIF